MRLQVLTDQGTPIRWGILSTANIAKKVSQAMIKAGDVVVAVGSRSKEKAEQWIKEEHLDSTAKAFGSYEDVLNQPDVDAVYIPLPTVYHCEWTIKCAKRKKHVLCEKPLARNSIEVREIIQACKENGVQFMDGVMWVHNKRTTEVKNKLPSLGNIHHIETHFTWDVKDTTNIRLVKDLEPLGALGDLGWYCLRAILFGYNNELPERVFASQQLLNGNGVPVHFNATLWFSHERTASFLVSFHIPTLQWYMFCGSQQTLQVNDFVVPWHAEPTLFPENTYDDRGVYTLQQYPGRVTTVQAQGCNQEVEMIRDFGEVIRGTKSGKEWEEASLHAQIIIDALVQSAETGQVVTVARS